MNWLKSQNFWFIGCVVLAIIFSFFSGKHSSALENFKARDIKEIAVSANRQGINQEALSLFLYLIEKERYTPCSDWIVSSEKIELWVLSEDNKRIVISLIKETQDLELRDENHSWRGITRPATLPT